ncbi:DUF2332 domain-containing protein [Rossellomorea oryzaecorticis]|uniref:DUF2332 domain-containing protein n=1 Tax=Rossellomorea oryzaecorticis TaxID=1396505 RepID=A0ABU9K600_9BACI
MSLYSISQRFKTFAEQECHQSSPLYEHLSHKIASDEELLFICTSCRKGQPVPNLLFGAVHYLLMNYSSHSLRYYYPSLVEEPLPVTESFSHFKDFCLQNKQQLTHLLQTKLVQTNEVRRCAYLYPAFCYMYERAEKPLALIEIGTSAGLQLAWDQYQYQYNHQETTFGNASSEVKVTSEIAGHTFPHLHSVPPPVSSRTGYDLHINEEQDFPWLLALIWPEHTERRDLFTSAAKMTKEVDIEFIEGDGVERFPDKINEITADNAICIFHTHVANQIPESSKRELQAKIKEIGKNHDIFHLYNNMWDRLLHLDCYINGIEERYVIGDTDGHGKWFQWNLSQESLSR